MRVIEFMEDRLWRFVCEGPREPDTPARWALLVAQAVGAVLFAALVEWAWS